MIVVIFVNCINAESYNLKADTTLLYSHISPGKECQNVVHVDVACFIIYLCIIHTSNLSYLSHVKENVLWANKHFCHFFFFFFFFFSRLILHEIILRS